LKDVEELVDATDYGNTLSEKTLSQLETKKRWVTVDELAVLAQVLGCSAAELLSSDPADDPMVLEYLDEWQRRVSAQSMARDRAIEAQSALEHADHELYQTEFRLATYLSTTGQTNLDQFDELARRRAGPIAQYLVPAVRQHIEDAALKEHESTEKDR
jgi:transcriptional regulator with XRE-family HTH domain